MIKYDKILFLKYKIQLQKYQLSYINSKNDQKNDYNQNTGPKLENLAVLHNQNLKLVSSVLARKLKCPSLARLGTFLARARSSRKIPARTHHYPMPNGNHPISIPICPMEVGDTLEPGLMIEILE